MKCFYHSSDLDGHCSGALVKMVYPEQCELAGINYGDEFPWDDIKFGETVYMVDFSLQPFEDMEKLATQCDLIWIDHHKTAIEEAHKRGFLAKEQILEIGIGACQLVWQTLWQGSENRALPTFIKLLAEYDVWDHSDPRTLSFQYGMRQYDTNPENQDFWVEFFDTERVQKVVEEGSLLLRYESVQNVKYVKACYFETELDGLKCIACNKMLTNSKLFDSVWDPEKYHAMLTFGYRKGTWTVSLYSTRDDVDVSATAKARGGGGHKGAAGFPCRELPFKLQYN